MALERLPRAGLTEWLLLIGTLSASHCAPSNTMPPAAPAAEVAMTSPAVSAEAALLVVDPAPTFPRGDDSRGGRLFDNWRSERKLSQAFVPDSAKTPAPDGKGGPNGNGTLNDSAGRLLLNTGHDYRLKNLFGWDLRGAEGVYGPAYQNKSYVLARNLLADQRSPEEIRRWLAEGDEQLPAYGQVLDAQDLIDLTTFLVKTRDSALARPDHVYRLEPAAPKNYTLIAGADAARGQERFGRTCAECHGKDGREFAIDGSETVGTLARSSAYEIWFKIQHGHPGSPMKRQVSEATGSDNGRAVLEILAALCDRRVFPALPGKASEDVPDGDVRCGGYLR
jgi:cytochrome c553